MSMTPEQRGHLEGWLECERIGAKGLLVAAYGEDGGCTLLALQPTLELAILQLRSLEFAQRRTAIVTHWMDVPAKVAFAIVLHTSADDVTLPSPLYMALHSGGCFLPASAPWQHEQFHKAWDKAWDTATMKILAKGGGAQCQH